MDPFSLILGVSGLALQLFGSQQKVSGAGAANAAQQKEVGLEQQGEAIRHQFMETDARRKQLEIVRNQQRTSALATNNAVTQGAQFGSGLQGGLGQIAGQSNTNSQGLMLSLMQGRQMFDINSQISQTKISQLAGQQQSSTGSALSGLGGTLIGAMGAAHQLGGFNTASSPSSTPNSNPFNYTGSSY